MGDLVSRTFMKSIGAKCLAYRDEKSGNLIAIMDIDLLPPAQSEGKWMHDGHHIRCTECGVYVCETDREGDAIPRNYCPNCGARMEEGEAE